MQLKQNICFLFKKKNRKKKKQVSVVAQIVKNKIKSFLTEWK